MDQDILVLTDGYFEKFFADRITTQDRDDIKQWLNIQLQQERQGWKNKLNMSLKEIERERRVALENQTALQNVHSLLVQFTRTYGPILSLDHGNITKSSVAKQVEYYAHLLLDLVNQFEEERIKCFDFLNLKDYQQMYLFEALKAHIEHLRDRIKVIQADAVKNEANLKEQIENISNNLNDAKKKHELEQARLNRMIQLLRDELEKLKNQPTPLQEKKATILYYDVAVQVEAWCLKKTKNCEAQTDPVRYESETKTDSSVKTDVEDSIIDHSVKELAFAKLHRLDIGAETESHNVNSNLSDSLHLSSVNEDELVNVSLQQDKETLVRKRPRKETKRYNNKPVIDELRTQVVSYAERIDRAKIDTGMDINQQQLFGVTVTGRPAPYRASNKGGMWHPSSQSYSTPREALQPGGFLGGIQKDLVYSTRDRNIVAALHANSRRGYDFNKGTNTSRCLRCHRTYKIRDNNPLACRFHPKSKKKLEKYDKAGNLVRMAYRWECCYQKAESTGCCSGEHI